MSAQSTASTATQSFLLLIARLGFAGVLVGRFWWRWQIEGLDAQIARLTEHAIPQPELIAWGTLLLEGVGGAILALGLLTRLVAALVAVENILIIAFIRWPLGLYAAGGGIEYNVTLAALGLVFLAVGARYAGLDALLFRRRGKAADDTATDLYQPKLGTTQL